MYYLLIIWPRQHANSLIVINDILQLIDYKSYQELSNLYEHFYDFVIIVGNIVLRIFAQ